MLKALECQDHLKMFEIGVTPQKTEAAFLIAPDGRFHRIFNLFSCICSVTKVRLSLDRWG
jgi:hypothetical protein